MNHNNKTANSMPKKKSVFDAQAFLDSSGVQKQIKEFKRSDVVYSQGDAAKSVLYLQAGSVKLSVVSEAGKEAVVAILGPGDFFGEGCLAGQSVRMGQPARLPQALCSSSKSARCSRYSMNSTTFPTGLSLSCWPETFASRKT
jgi:CRP-like cAMP-binding protein